MGGGGDKQDASDWLDSHPGAEKEEYEAEQKKLEEVYNPIIKKAYEGATAAGSTGGTETTSTETSGDEEGPSVEEVE